MTSRPGRVAGYGDKKVAPDDARCEICGKVGPFGFGPRSEFVPMKDSVKSYCREHRGEGERLWQMTRS